jgi:hypothetical protein
LSPIPRAKKAGPLSTWPTIQPKLWPKKPVTKVSGKKTVAGDRVAAILTGCSFSRWARVIWEVGGDCGTFRNVEGKG